jgi:hypothetical protein
MLPSYSYNYSFLSLLLPFFIIFYYFLSFFIAFPTFLLILRILATLNDLLGSDSEPNLILESLLLS